MFVYVYESLDSSVEQDIDKENIARRDWQERVNNGYKDTLYPSQYYTFSSVAVYLCTHDTCMETWKQPWIGSASCSPLGFRQDGITELGS